MQAMLQPFDAILNRITMYRLVLYGLMGLLAIAILLAAIGTFSISAPGLLVSVGLLGAGCFASNWALAKLFRAATNAESWLITALILACILPPVTSWERAGLVLLTGVIAMASKYVLVYRGSHIFNPAAVAALVVSATGLLPVTWWIANPTLAPLLVLLAIIILRKQRKFMVFGAFALMAVGILVFVSAGVNGDPLGGVLRDAVLSWPIIFMGSIMLTEPQTMPPTTRYQLLYAVLVGAIFSSQLHVGPFDSTPQAALIIGNLFTVLCAPSMGAMIRLRSVTALQGNQYHLVFTRPGKGFTFQPGQYMEWTLPHKNSDLRGNRRTFSIASAPTETDLAIGIRTYQPSSTFKQALVGLQPGQYIRVAHVAGNFTLPADPSIPLLFIAGGIGITPIRSMVQAIIDSNQQRDMVLVYTAASDQDFIYNDVFEAAVPHGLRVQHIAGRLDASELPALIPDIAQRTVYISGPNGMVSGYRAALTRQGIQAGRIKTDHFTGY